MKFVKQDRSFVPCDNCRPEIQRLGDVINTQVEIRHEAQQQTRRLNLIMEKAGRKRSAYIAEMLMQMAVLQAENKQLRQRIIELGGEP